MADIVQPETDSTEVKETIDDHTSEELESKIGGNSEDVIYESIDETVTSTDAKSGEVVNSTSTQEDASEETINELVTDIDNVSSLQLLAISTLEELASSDYIHNRQLAAKKILECLQITDLTQDELQTIISVMCKLSEDEESMVRSELVQHIPYIALHCRYNYNLQLVISQQLVPYTVKLLNDSQITVRKLAQSALLVLLENNLIRYLQLSEWICPLIAQLAVCESNSEEQRIEDVTVMCMMIPLVDEEIALKIFMEPFVALCCDPTFGIRTVCATKFGAVCKIAGTETTELSLLPSFLNLCCDDLWGIRKACADVFIDVATVVSCRIRKEVLPHIFINLLMDPSRHVKYSAYQSLGGFISTFAVSCTGGSPVLTSSESDEELNCSKSREKQKKVSNLKVESPLESDIHQEQPSGESRENVVNSLEDSPVVARLKLDSRPSIEIAAKDGHVFLHVNNEHGFNNFQFWRAPLPEVELDIDIDKGEATNIHIHAEVLRDEASQSSTAEIKLRISSDEDTGDKTCDSMSPATSKVQVQTMCINKFTSQINKQDSPDTDAQTSKSLVKETVYTTFKEDLLKIIDSGRFTTLSESKSNSWSEKGPENNPSKTKNEEPCSQDIVPPELLEKYLYVANQHTSVFDMNKQSDDERIGHCAYNFPAVANTLGKRYWNIISPTFKKLARDMKWTVRKTIASCLHELAEILGHDITVTDLFPIFLELIKDVDEVRLKLVEHLRDFLTFLNEEKKRDFLPAIKELSRLDNERNWRFRKALAKELQNILEWYDPLDVYNEFLPVALSLLQDRVFRVRRAAVSFVVYIVSHLYEDKTTQSHAITLLTELDSTYRQARKWSCRQTYVMLCVKIASVHIYQFETYFVDEIVPRLFSLAWDVVPNVRLAVSRCLAETLKRGEYLPKIAKSWPDDLQQVVFSLQGDVDQDVRHFAILISPKDFEEKPPRMFKYGISAREERCFQTLEGFNFCDGAA